MKTLEDVVLQRYLANANSGSAAYSETYVPRDPDTPISEDV